MSRRWIRLDVSWEDSWCDALTGAAAGCWPRLLCWVKRDGIKGRCKRPRTEALARRWRVEPADVLELEDAAKADGALTIADGYWTVTNWDEYQDADPTAAQRKREQRERERAVAPQEPSEPLQNGAETVTEVTRDTRDYPRDPSRATETETETETTTRTKSLARVREDVPIGDGMVHPGQRMPASAVLRAWESRQPHKLPDMDRQKHMRMARRIADNHTAQEIVLAFLGIGNLFPHAPPKSEPWDLFDLEKKFHKAMCRARDHPEIRNRQREAELLTLLEAV